MKLPSIVRLPNHKQFKYRPRYYDPDMEDLHHRVDEIKREMGETPDANHPYGQNNRVDRMKFRRPAAQAVSTSPMDSSTSLKLLIIFELIGNGYLYFHLGWTTLFQWILFGQVTLIYVWYRFRKFKKKRQL